VLRILPEIFTCKTGGIISNPLYCIRILTILPLFFDRTSSSKIGEGNRRYPRQEVDASVVITHRKA
jgi:hypothetical protein